MKTPYAPHYFDEDVKKLFKKPGTWVTASIASSIAWPQEDVCIVYAGDEFVLRGTERDGKPSPACISLQCNGFSVDEGIAKIYRFTSVLGWYKGGYVDVTGYISGSPALYGSSRNSLVTMQSGGRKYFNCTHMPVLDTDQQRKALAFWREGRRLKGVHDSFAFLSFYKVLESQFPSWRDKVAWISAAAPLLSDEAKERITDIQALGVDLNRHLYESGRCAVAHASFGGTIVDPDIPEDRRRLSSDLVIMEELARRFISDELRIPDDRSEYRTRDHLEPWYPLLSAETVRVLKGGGSTPDAAAFEGLEVSVRLWPDGPMPGMERLKLWFAAAQDGIVTLYALSERRTFYLVFHLDLPNGKIYADVEAGSALHGGAPVTEEEVYSLNYYFHAVIGNGLVEICHGALEPIDCEIVIPTNIIPQSPKRMAEAAVNRFRQYHAAQELGSEVQTPAVANPADTTFEK